MVISKEDLLKRWVALALKNSTDLKNFIKRTTCCHFFGLLNTRATAKKLDACRLDTSGVYVDNANEGGKRMTAR